MLHFEIYRNSGYQNTLHRSLFSLPKVKEQARDILHMYVYYTFSVTFSDKLPPLRKKTHDKQPMYLLYCYRNRERLKCNGVLIISKA